MTKRVPILLVTGFLGAGKTTFLNWLIHTHPDIKISLILNEFGDVKLENQFITESGGGEVAELPNGCMCCVAKNDIPRVINLILENSPQTEYIIIEASGLSDPDPILDALKNTELNEKITLESTLCIVDTLNFEKTRNEHAIILSQIGDADIVILSKVKEAGEETVWRVKSFVGSIGINTKVLLWDENLASELFLSSRMQQKIDEKESSYREHHHEHEEYDEFLFQTEKEVDAETFSKLMQNLPPQIVRAKGVINSQGKKFMVQYVSGKLDINEEESVEHTKTTILFLGKHINKQKLNTQLNNCISN